MYSRYPNWIWRNVPSFSLRHKTYLRGKGVRRLDQYLLKTFHQFDLDTQTSYDLLIDFNQNMSFRSRENYWISEQSTRIYNRGKGNQPSTCVAYWFPIHVPQRVICCNSVYSSRFCKPAAFTLALSESMSVARWLVETLTHTLTSTFFASSRRTICFLD